MEGEEIAQFNVLILDGSPDIVDFKSSLEGKGFSTAKAGTLKEALKLLRTHPIQVVLMDVSLPDVKGLDGFHSIRTEFPHVRAILLSGHVDVAMTVECMRAGAYAVFVKPPNLKVILQSLQAALDGDPRDGG